MRCTFVLLICIYYLFLLISIDSYPNLRTDFLWRILRSSLSFLWISFSKLTLNWRFIFDLLIYKRSPPIFYLFQLYFAHQLWICISSIQTFQFLSSAEDWDEYFLEQALFWTCFSGCLTLPYSFFMFLSHSRKLTK